jgi:dTDP-4-amino-4,6-dideoxygalactose transaminase
MIQNTIPFVDLISPHREMERELMAVVRHALTTAEFIGGPMVESFEREFAQFCGSRYCVGVGSGTDALRFALAASGILPGEAVITVPNTFIATTEAISQIGAVPEFVDVDERTHTMDPKKLREHLRTACDINKTTKRPRSRRTGRRISAIVPVHLYGQTADMDPILEVAEEHNLTVIEDACQAHGAEYFSEKRRRWLKAGTIGRAAAFSFYPGKNLGACGEAGAVTTEDEELARNVRVLRDHGQEHKYVHSMEGYNGRLDAIQAGILSIKLKHLTRWNKMRREAAARYHQSLSACSSSLVVPYEPSWARAVYHLYVIRTNDRDDVRKELGHNGISTGIHYPIPLHLQKAYSELGYKSSDFPNAEKACSEVLSLPMFPTISPQQQSEIVQTLLSVSEAAAA